MLYFEFENETDVKRYSRLRGEMIAKHEELQYNSPMLKTEFERKKLFGVIYTYLKDINFSDDIGFQEVIRENFVLIDFMGSLETDIEGISASYDKEGNISIYVRTIDSEQEELFFTKYSYSEKLKGI